MRKSFWRQVVVLSALLAILTASATWATPELAGRSASPSAQGAVALWWNAVVDLLGWSSWKIEGGSAKAPEAINLEDQALEPDPTSPQESSGTDGGPSLDPDG